MIITARFNSRCPVCSAAIPAGTRVWWTKGSPAIHATCHEEKGAKVVEAVAESLATDADVSIPCPSKLAYLPFQRAGIAFACKRRNALIADEMGLGKTIQGIGVLNSMPEVRTVLVVCPASLKLNWRAEILKWSVRTPSIEVTGEKKSKRAVKSEPLTDDLRIIIANYDVLSKVDLEAVDLLLVDEAHYAKNVKAQRTKHLARLVKCASKIVFMTGTPISNRPSELWSLLQMLDPQEWDPAGFVKGNPVPAGGGAGFWRFHKRYANAQEKWVHTKSGQKKVWDFSGASNLDELQERLRSTVMIRRTKESVLKDLPPKTRQVIEVETENECESDGFDIDEESYERVTSSVAFEEWSATRHAQALEKVPQVVDHVRECLEASDRPIVLFAHHRDVIALLSEEFCDVPHVVVTGETSKDARHSAVEQFQNAASGLRLFIGSIGAAGTGLTLTRSSHVVYAELDPRPYIMSQSEDRCHRIGQRDNVLVQHIVAKGSIDAKIAQILTRKQAVIHEATDAPLDYAVPSVSEIRDDIEFTSCTCLAAPGAKPSEHTSWCDMFGSDGEHYLSPEEIERIHQALRTLAANCDGAATRDAQGFNRFDADWGKKLAALPSLSVKQALRAREMLVKYRRQIGDV